MRVRLQRWAVAGAVGVGVVAGVLRGPDPEARPLAETLPADTFDLAAGPMAGAAPEPDALVVPRAAPPAAVRVARAVLAGVGEGERPSTREARVTTALEVLGRRVGRGSHPDALATAFRAYFAFRAENPHRVRKPYLYFVDYGLDSRTPRGWVFDMDALEVVEGPFLVAHGRGSEVGRSGVPTRFSNRHGSNATSLGLFLAQETYAFRGTSDGRAYRSIGLRLAGLSGRFNGEARARGVVVHGAPYVTATRAGRSEGCPAMDPARARRLIPRIAQGSLVFLYSPRDPSWLSGDPWANAADAG